MSRQRQSIENSEVKNKILDTARSIVEKEGIEKLSIRKITKTLDYSPGIVYHYFKDKDEILETILQDGYMKIIHAIKSAQVDEEDPVQELKKRFENYIYSVLSYGKEYKAFVLCEKPNILENTKILFQGVHKIKPSMAQLYGTLQRGKQQGVFSIFDIELTAQSLWVSVNGLLLRLIIEEVDKEYADKLIQTHMALLLKSIC